MFISTKDSIKNYEREIRRWLASKSIYGGLLNPEPEPKDFGLDAWVAKQIKSDIERQFAANSKKK